MGQEIVRRFFSREDGEEKKPIKPIVVWLIIGSILFLALGSFRGDHRSKEQTVREVPWEEEMDGYIEKMESRLEENIGRIHGAGEVSVFLNVVDGREEILAANKTLKSQKETEENGETKLVEEESDILQWDQDGIEVPYRIKQRFPEPAGILVVAEGAGTEQVRREIYEAVRAIFGLPAHRIKITN